MDEVTEDDELTSSHLSPSGKGRDRGRFARWASKEAVVGSAGRMEQVAKDFVEHFEARIAAMEGKGLFVAMSRRICVALHDEIVKLRPEWYSADDDKGAIKVIMTGSSSDPLDWQEHIRSKSRRKAIGDRLKDPADPLKLVIVRDMWLTGFDAPALHTLYVDKPMNGHNLMQAIARVNRVFGDKTGGLVVDYIGIAQDLKKALATYTENKGRGKLTFDQAEAVAKMQEFYEVVVNMFGAFDYRAYFSKTPRERLLFILDATNFILGLDDGKARFKGHVQRLSQAFGLAVPHPDAIALRDDLAFFQAVRARIVKIEGAEPRKRSNEEIETAIRQIIDDAIVSDEVVDVFDAAGIRKPDISILSDSFLAEIKNMPRKNLALELLKRLLNDEIKSASQRNTTQSRKFSELLSSAIKRYQSGLVDSATVMQELIELACKLREEEARGKSLGLRHDELAFYDALAENDAAQKIMEDETLKAIARELVDSVRRNTSIDWQLKESVQAKLRVLVKRILWRYKYPPDDPATGAYTISVNRVLDQAEVLADGWAG